VGAGGTSAPSAVLTVSTLLNPPTTFTAAAANATRVNLTWSTVTNATSYKIERSLNNSTWTALAPSPALTGTSNSYGDTTAAANTTYYYRIPAANAAGTAAP